VDAKTAEDFDMAADPDGDGFANVFEMAFLRNPHQHDSTPVSFVPAGSDHTGRWFDLEFTRHRDAGKFVTFRPVKSSNLLTWKPLADDEWQILPALPGWSDPRPDAERMRWRIFAPIAEPMMHFRIETTANPN